MAVALCASAGPAAGTPPPGIARAGLEGSEFLAPNGNTDSQTIPSPLIAQLQGQASQYPQLGGRVLGYTNRWINDPSRGGDIGFSVPFLFDHGTTTRLGLVDFEHRDDFGGSDGFVYAISTNGHIAGTSTRYFGTAHTNPK